MRRWQGLKEKKMKIDTHSKFGLVILAFTLLLSFCNNTKKSGPIVVLRSESNAVDWSAFYAELAGARQIADSAFYATQKQIKKQKTRKIRLVQEHADGIIPVIDY